MANLKLHNDPPLDQKQKGRGTIVPLPLLIERILIFRTYLQPQSLVSPFDPKPSRNSFDLLFYF
jgi:hypothetical protein